MYKFIEDLTSDVMFIAEAPDLASLLEESSKAVFDVVCQRNKIVERVSVAIKAEGVDAGKLLYEWLSQLLTESDAQELFFSRFEVAVKKVGDKYVAEGRVFGEPYSQEKGGTVVKGVTLYGFKVEKTKSGYSARVACD